MAKEKIAESVGESMQRLGVQKVHVLYVHAPDKETPIVEQAEEFERQYELGRFEQVSADTYKCSDERDACIGIHDQSR